MDPLPGLRAGLRRTKAQEPRPAEGEPALVELIRAEIESTGAITFARFMELALYHPELGYYRAAAEAPGRGGDFLTAPEAHPIFGHAIARQLDEMWQILGEPDAFTVREYGAGAGALGLAILQGLQTDRSGLAGAVRYEPVEVNAHRRAELVDRLAAAGFRDRVSPVTAFGAGVAPGPVVGCVLANEFLDALPVHRVEQAGGELRELYVGWLDGRFVDVAGPVSTRAIEARLAAEGVRLAEGQRAEVGLAVDDWIAEVSAGLARGFALVIDYGYPAADLYAPSRAAGTLLAYARHRVHDDPYRSVGRQDLTAHVDFTAVERAAAANGLTVLGQTTQAEFLVGVGTQDLLAAIQADRSTAMEDYLALRSALMRMLDPRAMGRFLVLVLGRDVRAHSALSGLSFRLHRRDTQPEAPAPGR